MYHIYVSLVDQTKEPCGTYFTAEGIVGKVDREPLTPFGIEINLQYGPETLICPNLSSIEIRLSKPLG